MKNFDYKKTKKLHMYIKKKYIVFINIINKLDTKKIIHLKLLKLKKMMKIKKKTF